MTSCCTPKGKILAPLFFCVFCFSDSVGTWYYHGIMSKKHGKCRSAQDFFTTFPRIPFSNVPIFANNNFFYGARYIYCCQINFLSAKFSHSAFCEGEKFTNTDFDTWSSCSHGFAALTKRKLLFMNVILINYWQCTMDTHNFAKI